MSLTPSDLGMTEEEFAREKAMAEFMSRPSAEIIQFRPRSQPVPVGHPWSGEDKA
jgi:hypothetical protein